MSRHRNDGIRKICDCARRNWPKCPHAWHFNYKVRGGRAYRFSLAAELGRPIEKKEDAKAAAEDIRRAIRAGTFVRSSQRASVPASAAPDDAITLELFTSRYIERHASQSGKKTWKNDKFMLARLCAFDAGAGATFGAKRLDAITEDDLEAFLVALRTKGRAASTRNHYVQVLKASFRWAAKKGYLTRSPISDDSTLTRSKIAQRARRLVADVLDDKGKVKEPGEERRLIAATEKNPGMQRLIIAALETGCRRGELLALTWADVDLDRKEFRVKAETAKDGELRVLPISTRFAGVLEMAKVDPAGQEYKPTDFVFGECGKRVKNTKRAWSNACTRAGITDLHFHDLRHEAGSRLLEAGWPIHHVKEMLGHANLSQTSTYLNAGRMGLRDSMQRFDPARCNPVANGTSQEPPLTRNDEPQETPKHLVN